MIEEAKSVATPSLTLPCHMLNQKGELGRYTIVFIADEALIKSYHSGKVKTSICLKNVCPRTLLKEEMVSESLTSHDSQETQSTDPSD